VTLHADALSLHGAMEDFDLAVAAGEVPVLATLRVLALA
jgi:hypothetical protein